MSTPPPLPAKAPAKKRLGRWRIPLIILGVLVGMALLFALLIGAYIWLAEELPVTEDDRAVLVTAAWVADWVDDMEVDPKLETTKKVRNFDGSYELSYEYDGEYIYLSCEVSVEESVSDAKGSYWGITKGQAIAFRLDGIEARANPRLLQWGDESICSLLHDEEGEVSGNYFACRDGTRTFLVLLGGWYFDDPETLRDFLVPILRRLRNYQP